MDITFQAMLKVLDAVALRQRVVSHNLANANTPGYVRQDVAFQRVLAEAIRSKNPTRVARVTPEIRPDLSEPRRPDGNNVSTQKEVAAIGENALLYAFGTRVINAKVAMLRKAIGGR